MIESSEKIKTPEQICANFFEMSIENTSDQEISHLLDQQAQSIDISIDNKVGECHLVLRADLKGKLLSFFGNTKKIDLSVRVYKLPAPQTVGVEEAGSFLFQKMIVKKITTEFSYRDGSGLCLGVRLATNRKNVVIGE